MSEGSPGPSVDLRALVDAEAGNLQASLENLAECVPLIDRCFGLYSWLSIREGTCDVDWREEISDTHFIIGAGRDLYAAALAAMRAHGSDAAMFTRRAVESAGFVIAIHRDRSLFRTWKDARDGPGQAKAYRDAFRTVLVLPPHTEEPRLKFLRQVFNRASELSHPSLLSFAGKLKPVVRDDGSRTAQFNFFESARARDAAQALHWTLHAHEGILRALTELYLEPLQLASTEWPRQLETWSTDCEGLRRRWEST